MDVMTDKYIEYQIQDFNKDALAIASPSTRKFIETMKKLLERKDKPLIKADIVAILISLKPELLNRIEELDTFTVPQLNSMVRATMYDTTRLVEISSQHKVYAIHDTKAPWKESLPSPIGQNGQALITWNNP
jgi:hypothetical protein